MKKHLAREILTIAKAIMAWGTDNVTYYQVEKNHQIGILEISQMIDRGFETLWTYHYTNATPGFKPPVINQKPDDKIDNIGKTKKSLESILEKLFDSVEYLGDKWDKEYADTDGIDDKDFIDHYPDLNSLPKAKGDLVNWKQIK